MGEEEEAMRRPLAGVGAENSLKAAETKQELSRSVRFLDEVAAH